jgi:hypothetical protein
MRALDSEGRSYVILAITPVEVVQTYHGLRKERGRVRHELNDGTSLVALSETQFRIESSGTILDLVRP